MFVIEYSSVFMSSSLLRKFKVIRCPLDNEVLRPRAFITHVKKHHKKHTQQWEKQVQKEESCLICTSSRFHSRPAVELTVATRNGNNHFIRKHAAHLPLKQMPLSDTDKEAVRQKLFASNVDIDATPPPPPVAIPSPHKAVGVVENWQHLVTPEVPEEEAQTIFPTDMIPPITSPTFSDIILGTSTLPVMNISELEASLHLDTHDPLERETDAAEMLTDIYKQIFEPGLRYPFASENTQADAPNHAATSTTELHVPSALHDQSMQADAPSQQHASTSMSELLDETKKMTDSSTSPADTEDIPLLTQGIEHVREVNKMKNVMLSQIMQDNIDLLESKVQSRKRALQVMENLFETRAQKGPAMSDDITLELSRIIHLKNKFIQQLLRETARLHPQIYNMMQN